MNADRRRLPATGLAMPWWGWVSIGGVLIFIEFVVSQAEEAGMPSWVWVAIGVGLVCVEMFFVDAQFYLLFIGASAVAVGLLGIIGVPMPDWAQWLVFAALAVVSLIAFRRGIYDKLRGSAGHVDQAFKVGDRVAVPVTLDPGQTCRVEYRGTSWSARNVDVRPIAAGEEAAIASVDGLTLNVTGRVTGRA